MLHGASGIVNLFVGWFSKGALPVSSNMAGKSIAMKFLAGKMGEDGELFMLPKGISKAKSLFIIHL